MTTTYAGPAAIINGQYMSIDRFLEELVEVRAAFRWESQYGPRERVRGFGNIRAVCQDLSYCPITAVVMAIYGETYLMNAWGLARIRLGLTEDDALLIAEAADAPLNHNTELLDLHYRLLDALGL